MRVLARRHRLLGTRHVPQGVSLSVVGKERTPHTLACSTTALPAPRGEALATGSTALSSVLERQEEE